MSTVYMKDAVHNKPSCIFSSLPLTSSKMDDVLEESDEDCCGIWRAEPLLCSSASSLELIRVEEGDESLPLVASDACFLLLCFPRDLPFLFLRLLKMHSTFVLNHANSKSKLKRTSTAPLIPSFSFRKRAECFLPARRRSAPAMAPPCCCYPRRVHLA